MTILEPDKKNLVLKGLDDVCSREKFGRSKTLATLLRYLTKKTLEGEGPELMRKQIAEEYYGIQMPTDDDCSRVGARLSALRQSLGLYNYKRGHNDPVRFELSEQGFEVKCTFAQLPNGDGHFGSPIVDSVPSLPDFLRDTLLRSGLKNAFRIKVQNDERRDRVTELIRDECKRRRPFFRLLASSGHSYLPPAGPVWEKAKLGEAVVDRNATFEVILESPFSDFAECRALANDTTKHQWEEKVNLSELQKLISKSRGVSVKVTSIPVNCSLFFTSTSVLFDPYLWGRPDSLQRSENNFWVLEFVKSGDREYDCYEILTRHFTFVQQQSVPFSEFVGRGRSYARRTAAFELRMKRRLKSTKASRSQGKRSDR